MKLERPWVVSECSNRTVKAFIRKYHAYGSDGGNATLCHGVFEGEKLVACFTWKQAIIGLAKSVRPHDPQGVLSLSRMVAVPKTERQLKHISKPLKVVMNSMLDRARYPHLVTFSDRSLGHNGFVYLCSGWTKTGESYGEVWTDELGNRKSPSSNGKSVRECLFKTGVKVMDRWEHVRANLAL